MTDEHRQIREQQQRLSALQDGELDPGSTSSILEAMTSGRELRATWERYHLIGHVIRGEHLDPAFRGVAERVRASLVAEPILLDAKRIPAGRLRKLSSMAALALAAGVVFVALIMTPTILQEKGVPSSAGPMAARLVEPEPREVESWQRWHLDRPDLASKLDRFLVTHQETAPVAGAKGMLPYATFVGYDVPR